MTEREEAFLAELGFERVKTAWESTKNPDGCRWFCGRFQWETNGKKAAVEVWLDDSGDSWRISRERPDLQLEESDFVDVKPTQIALVQALMFVAFRRGMDYQMARTRKVLGL